MSVEKKKKTAKKSGVVRRAKKVAQKPLVVAPAPEKKTPLARATFVLNRVVIVSSISAYVTALVLAGLSTLTLAVAPSGNLSAATLCMKIGGGQAVNANADGSCPAGYSGDGNPPPVPAVPVVPAAGAAPAAPVVPAAGAAPAAPVVPAAGAAPAATTGGTPAAPAATGNSGDLKTNLDAAGSIAYPGGGPANIGKYIAKFLLFFFGALGMMFATYIFYAGFLWLTAAGEEDKVKKARAIIFHSIFALSICVMAFTISKFWLEGLAKAAR